MKCSELQRAAESLGVHTQIILSAAYQSMEKTYADENIGAVARAIAELVGKANASFEKQTEGDRLTPIGLDEARLRVIKELKTELAALRARTVGVLESRVAGMRDRLRAKADTTPKDPADVLRREVRASEIRQRFVGMDRIELQAAYFGANAEVREALRNDPFDALGRDFVDARLAEEERANNGAGWEAHDDLEHLACAESALFASVTSHLPFDPATVGFIPAA